MKRKNNYIFVFILAFSLLIMIDCKKEAIVRKNQNTIVKGNINRKIVKPEIKEIKTFGNNIGGNQYAGVSFEKNEFYIVDHHTERKNGKLLLEMIDMNTGEIKDKKRLLMGDYHSPACFTDTFGEQVVPVYVYYFNNNYYLLNYNKIVLFGNDPTHLKATFFEHSYSGLRLNYLLFFKKEDKNKVLIASKYLVHKGNTKIKETEDRFKLSVFNLSFKEKLSSEKIIDFINIKTDMMVMDESRGKFVVHLYYIVPLSSGLVMGEKIYYSFNFERGYHVMDTKTGKTVFIKLMWLKPKVYTDKDAYNIGTYRMKDWSNNPRAKKVGTKIYYTSYKGKLYFLKMVRIGKNRIGFVSDIDSKKRLMFVDIINGDRGDYKETIVLPFGSLFGRDMHGVDFTVKSFFIDYEKGIYVYGDRTKEWDDIVRYCRFKIHREKE